MIITKILWSRNSVDTWMNIPLTSVFSNIHLLVNNNPFYIFVLVKLGRVIPTPHHQTLSWRSALKGLKILKSLSATTVNLKHIKLNLQTFPDPSSAFFWSSSNRKVLSRLPTFQILLSRTIDNYTLNLEGFKTPKLLSKGPFKTRQVQISVI